MSLFLRTGAFALRKRLYLFFCSAWQQISFVSLTNSSDIFSSFLLFTFYNKTFSPILAYSPIFPNFEQKFYFILFFRSNTKFLYFSLTLGRIPVFPTKSKIHRLGSIWWTNTSDTFSPLQAFFYLAVLLFRLRKKQFL